MAKQDDGAQILPFKVPKRSDNSVLGNVLSDLSCSKSSKQQLSLSSGQMVDVELDGPFWLSLARIAEIEEVSLTQLVEKTHFAKPNEMELSEALKLVAVFYTSSFLETSLQVIEDFLSTN